MKQGKCMCVDRFNRQILNYAVLENAEAEYPLMGCRYMYSCKIICASIITLVPDALATSKTA